MQSLRSLNLSAQSNLFIEITDLSSKNSNLISYNDINNFIRFKFFSFLSPSFMLSFG